MTAAPRYRVRSVRASERPVRMRLPFRFGDTVVRETAEAYVAIEVEGRNGVSEGFAAQLMVPRWFDKRSSLTNDDTVAELRETMRRAGKEAIGLSGTAREISLHLRSAVRRSMPAETPRLAADFGPALCETALIDAACRDLGLAFPDAVRRDAFGLAADCPPDLSPDELRKDLAGLSPRWEIAIRHTVGYDAPLTPADVAERPEDGLPVALTEVVAVTGVRRFKIKLKGDPDADIARLLDIVGVLKDGPAYEVTLDANEQYSGAAFDVFLSGFKSDPDLARMRDATLYIEQPFARDAVLADDAPKAPAGIPLLIDESDDSDDAFARAAAKGWAGVSVKSCKGVLRALLNSARVAALRRQGRPAILSAEDLTCQPGLSWQQDTLMAATVGAVHVERNGHHFAGGMQGASDQEVSAAVAAHADLYTLAPDGRPTLRITEGRVRFASLGAAGFASVPPPDLGTGIPIAFEEE